MLIADLLNMVLFGKTAKTWREHSSDKEGNIRDYASVEQLGRVSKGNLPPSFSQNRT